MIPQPKDAELFIGIVARVGVDTKSASEIILDTLKDYLYEVFEIKTTSAVAELPAFKDKLTDLTTEQRYEKYIEACNQLRKEHEQPDIMARFALSQINDARPDEGQKQSPLIRSAFLKRRAYIVNQLKREEEMELLRATYGEHYIQISLHANAEIREKQLANKIADDHPDQPRAENWLTDARKIMDADEAQEAEPYGQRVRDVFPLSDVVIDASTTTAMKKGLSRFFRALFGDPRVTPTRVEYGMQLANTAALRSADLSRQVGAAILNVHSEVQALGCNEVPKAKGGTYWEGDRNDAREFQLDKDSNDERKKELLLDIASRMIEAGLIDENYRNPKDLRQALLVRNDKIISGSQLMDSLEYGRTVHAEMNAITDAARNGHAVRECILFCNTFPCHNCAKHIVASGISDLYYLRPYPKSYARQLFSDSICIDPPVDVSGKVHFRQFIGIVGNLYERVFSKTRWKSADGSVPKFVKSNASFIRRTAIPSYGETELQIALDLSEALQMNTQDKGEAVPAPVIGDTKTDGNQ